MLCHHLSGLATADELEAHLAGLEKPARLTPGTRPRPAGDAANAARCRPPRPGDRPRGSSQRPSTRSGRRSKPGAELDW